MSSPNGMPKSLFGQDLETFLRRSLSGYVYLLLTAPIFLTKFSQLKVDFPQTFALLVIAGFVIGEIIYEIYHAVFWFLAWRVGFHWFWGLHHIQTLRKRGRVSNKDRDIDDRYLRAFWDEVFFEPVNKDETKRILNLFSSAHGSATSSIAIILSLLTIFLCNNNSVGCGDYWLFVNTLLVTVAGLLLFNHWRLCRDAGASENTFLDTHWSEVDKKIEDHCVILKELDP